VGGLGGIRAEMVADVGSRPLQWRDAVVSQHGCEAGSISDWAGSHLASLQPDNKFSVTAMHEPALHGWRLADNRHMR
jgi:hypothetical protein